MSFYDDIILGNRLQNLPLVTLPLSIQGEPADDLLIAGENALLFSDRLLHLLLSSGVDSLDYYPINIRSTGAGPRSYKYNLIVIRDHIFCLDKENSDLYFAYDDPGRGIEELFSVYINEEMLDSNYDLFFRLGEYRSIVIVHEKIKTLFIEGGMTGAIFTEADGSYPIISPERQMEGFMYERAEYDYSYMLEDEGSECLNVNFPSQRFIFKRTDVEDE